jgi:hypothetical protein
MLKMLEFLRDMEMIKQIDMLKDIQQVDRQRSESHRRRSRR